MSSTEILQNADSDTICCICWDSLIKPGLGRQTLPCKHTFHEQCVTQMRRDSSCGKCPICREETDELTPVQVLIRQAVHRYELHDYNAAVHALMIAFDVDPDNGRAAYMLGVLTMKGLGVNKDTDRAIDLFKVALAEGTASACIHLGMLSLQNDEASAVEYFEEARRRGMPPPLILGELYEANDETCQAQLCYEELCAAGTDLIRHSYVHGSFDTSFVLYHIDEFVEAHFRLGICHHECGNLNEARMCWLKAYRLGFEDAAFQLGTSYDDSGDVDKAQQWLERGVAHGHTDSMYNLAALLLDKGEKTKAKALLEKASEKGSTIAADKLKDLDHAERRDANRPIIQDFLSAMTRATWGTSRGLDFELMEQIKPGSSQRILDHIESNPPEDMILIGSRVKITNLKSQAGQALEGKSGTVNSYDSIKHRFGVKIDGVNEIKSICFANLALIKEGPGESYGVSSSSSTSLFAAPDQSSPSCEPRSACSAEDLQVQAAIESSLSAATEVSINAQISNALLRTRPVEVKSPQVVLITLSRHPKMLRDALLQEPSLQECRRALESSGFSVEQDSGAKIFVEPSVFEAVLCAVRLGKYRINSGSVICDLELEDAVVAVVRNIPKNQHVRLKRSTKVPLGFSTEVARDVTDIQVKRTFIQVQEPSSLLSTTSPGLQTSSTMDAGKRNGKFRRPVRGKDARNARDPSSSALTADA